MPDHTVSKARVARAVINNSLLWLALSLSVIFLANRSLFFPSKLRYSVLNIDSVLRIPGWEILWFIAGMTVAYIAFAAALYLFAWPLVRRRPAGTASVWVHILGLLLGLGACALNQWYFPHSSTLLRLDTSLLIAGTDVPLYPVLLAFTVALVALYAALYWAAQMASLRTGKLLLPVAILASASALFAWASPSAPPRYLGERPNIILLGIDSLRSDVFANDSLLPLSLPTLKRWSERAVVFSDTQTPLARTNGAWVSLLTGQFPADSGIRFNLMRRDLIQPGQFLQRQLGAVGFQSFYASDERRFSPIDERFGFDYSSGPITGASDFLFGAMSDTPISNLWLATPLGRYLFPHSYGNRAVARSYEPEHFLATLDKDLRQLNPQQPAFIAVHLCLPHWPYVKRDSQVDMDALSRLELYGESIEDADAMLTRVLAMPVMRQRLDNALVVLLSDHGEGFPELHNDADDKQNIHTAGHGTNVVDADQYQVFMAIQQYRDGQPVHAPATNKQPASLIDLYATIANFAGMPPANPTPGINLLPLLSRQNPDPIERTRYMETGFNTTSLLVDSGPLDDTKIAAEGIEFYQVNRDGQMEIKDALIPELMVKKERAAQRGELLLALRDTDTGFELFQVSGRNPLSLDFRNAAHRKLVEDFCTHYSRDLASYLPDFQGCSDLALAQH